MSRQILAVLLGIALSYLAAGGFGYLIYQMSNSLGNQGPLLARLIVGPLIALIAGASVGALARSRPAVLAALSLAPWGLSLFFAQRQDYLHYLLLVLLDVLYLFVGMAAAALAYRRRIRNLPGDPVGI